MNHNVETCAHRYCEIVPASCRQLVARTRCWRTCQVRCPDCGYTQARGENLPPDAAWTREFPQPPSAKGRVVQRALAEVLRHRGLPLSEPQWGLPVTHAYARGAAPGDPDYNGWHVALTRRAVGETDWSTTVCLAAADTESAALEAALNLARNGCHPQLDSCIAAYQLGGPVCLASDLIRPGATPAPA